MARRESLRQYQDELLARMDRAREAITTSDKHYLGFQAGAKKFLLDGMHILTLAPASGIEPMPSAKPWAPGAASIKGVVYCITDFSLLLGGEQIKKGKFIVLRKALIQGAALMIEGISGVFEAGEIGEAIPVDFALSMPDWITGSHIISGERHFIVDGLKLVNDTRFSQLQSGDNA